MQSISLALLWHQHQPYYPDNVSGETLMPWVRLHGTKDYYGMALHLKEVPEFRCTINLVPSLLVQLQAYCNQTGSDRHLDLSRIPADGLNAAEARYIVENFFTAQLDGMIRPYPRYFELYQKRAAHRDDPRRALTRFNVQDLRDLQVWSNLTWFHELCFEQDSALRDFRAKGRNWSEAEKSWLLDRQREVLQRIIPLHRELEKSGQIEISTTPFYHPILPLLWDKRSAREAMPAVQLPRNLESWKEDAAVHVARAVAFHRELFGAAPAGMWPAEGSVSQAVLPTFAGAGIQWIATDEEILSRSTNGWVSRDPAGHMRNPEMLYRPWRVEEQGQSLQILFRDHGLSDLIGFHYQRSHPVRAAQDLIGRLEQIARAVDSRMGNRPALVPIILDGENCWEYYPDGGVGFLRSFYTAAARHSQIRPTRIRDHLAQYPATDRIGTLFAGSWISHNFAIWIGHPEDNAAWDLLHQTRQFLVRAQESGKYAAADLQRAWEEIYIAEGSDWFWWYGDDHNSGQDELFDELFRKHLQNVYTLLGEAAPAVLNRPLTQAEKRTIHTSPKGFLSVKVDGRRTYFEWLNAARYAGGGQRGTMAMTSEAFLREVYFGFDLERLMVRIDTARRARDDLRSIDELRISFLEPNGYMLRVFRPSVPDRTLELLLNNEPVPAKIEFAVDQIVELTLPFAALGVVADDRVQMCVEAWSDRQSIDRAPREGILELTVPSEDYERIMWQA